MERSLVKIGILTSSRADYGIYLPLLSKLESDYFFDVQLLVFGTHLSDKYGYTVKQIELDGFKICCSLQTTPLNDSPGDISKSMATTMSLFTDVWERNKFDMLFVLGDRYEMFSAAASSVPFNIPLAHIHGGETTLGAIDNSFRHSITAMAELHFTSCEAYKNRVIELKGNANGVYNVGALSIDLLCKMQYLTINEFYQKYSIDLNKPTILFTFHPETVSFSNNQNNIKILLSVLRKLRNYQIVFTMPNADTNGKIIRNHLKNYLKKSNNLFGIESFGSVDYLTCMKYCSFMLGNSSSGFVEASWFPKPVINVGKRQEGRIQTPNIFSCNINETEILNIVKQVEKMGYIPKTNIYGIGTAAENIIGILKKHFKGRI